ncbi:hypothetical protein [Notoacmeibacter marinus]|nr:hypothetical protein [Notoacmeibacter marinus]
MTTKKEKPPYRLTFSRITGKDESGQDVLSRPYEIGVAWARKGGKKGCVISIEIIPTDLVNRNGVLFLVPTEPDERGFA